MTVTHLQAQTGRLEQGEMMWFSGKSRSSGHESDLILHLKKKDHYAWLT